MEEAGRRLQEPGELPDQPQLPLDVALRETEYMRVCAVCLSIQISYLKMAEVKNIVLTFFAFIIPSFNYFYKYYI